MIGCLAKQLALAFTALFLPWHSNLGLALSHKNKQSLV